MVGNLYILKVNFNSAFKSNDKMQQRLSSFPIRMSVLSQWGKMFDICDTPAFLLFWIFLPIFWVRVGNFANRLNSIYSTMMKEGEGANLITFLINRYKWNPTVGKYHIYFGNRLNPNYSTIIHRKKGRGQTWLHVTSKTFLINRNKPNPTAGNYSI